jgi:hypothetical protein
MPPIYELEQMHQVMGTTGRFQEASSPARERGLCQ